MKTLLYGKGHERVLERSTDVSHEMKHRITPYFVYDRILLSSGMADPHRRQVVEYYHVFWFFRTFFYYLNGCHLVFDAVYVRRRNVVINFYNCRKATATYFAGSITCLKIPSRLFSRNLHLSYLLEVLNFPRPLGYTQLVRSWFMSLIRLSSIEDTFF